MSAETVIVALSGGVDSAVAAHLLKRDGYDVQCLHMTNWEDDGYCDSAAEFQDARRVCTALGVPLHRVNFAREYREQVFEEFLDELRCGRTPNPDVTCNRQIKFGAMKHYAARLGGQRLATGHYARVATAATGPILLKGADPGKDQSYFLHAVSSEQLDSVLFPLGAYTKSQVRDIARRARFDIADKKDSTGICFIGERPFSEFLGRYLPVRPGPIEDAEGTVLGQHGGLAFYTLGQRHGLGIGGHHGRGEAAWYVAAKRIDDNVLVVVQGNDHPLLFSRALVAVDPRWIGPPPSGLLDGRSISCHAKTRYRQSDQACRVQRVDEGALRIAFDRPQRAVTPGQYAVLYDGERCLGGATIQATHSQ